MTFPRRPFLRVCALLAAVLILLASPGGRIPSARGDEPAAKGPAAVRARMQAFVAAGEISGAVTVVGRAKGEVRIEAVGSRDLETMAPMPEDALFRIASMTKPVTAVGVL